MWRIAKFILAAPIKMAGAAFLLAGAMVGASGHYTIIPTSELRAVTYAEATEADELEAAQPEQKGLVFPQAKTFSEQMEKAGFSQRFLFEDAHAAGAKEQPKTRIASLTPATALIKLPQEKPKAKPAVWNPTLEQRKGIARAYLKRACREVIKFDGKESAADKLRVEARFMRATSRDQIIGIVNSEIRSSLFLRALGYCPSIMAGG